MTYQNLVDSELDSKLGANEIERLGVLLESNLDKIECKSKIMTGDVASAEMTEDDKITLAIETLSNMTDFGSFKTTMLAKQSAQNTGGNF